MPGLYEELAVVAQELLDEFGAGGTLRKLSDPSYDPTSGEATRTTADTDVQAAVFDAEEKFRAGTAIRNGDKDVYMAVTGVQEPREGDQFIWGGKKYDIVRPLTIGPARINVLYTFRASKPS